MNALLVSLLILTFLASVFFVAVLLGVQVPGFSGNRAKVRSSLRNLSGTARGYPSSNQESKGGAFEKNLSLAAGKRSNSQVSLQKRLRFAQLKMTPLTVRIAEVVISFFSVLIAYFSGFSVIFLAFSLLVGPMFMGWMINFLIDRRFKAFDADYSPFLMSMVSLIKTGMNVMGGLEAAAKGLEEGSLVRAEVEQMVERLRYGVSEEKSIGAFGEDVNHPEIELFVQALLLSKSVGGTLSDTLERLARQVRRRQFFRLSAAASISQQRGSIWVIIGIMICTELYMYWVYPELITNAIKNPVGWGIWQGAFLFILGGIYWIRQITKIRV